MKKKSGYEQIEIEATQISDFTDSLLRALLL
jgi:hypothetical protein